jgi:hypothetical protein
LALINGKLPWIETPVIEKSNAFVRAMISAGMRRGIPDPSTRARTITLFTDAAALRREMGLPGDGKVVVVMVLNRSGQVLALTQGTFTTDAAARLLELLTGQ